jgi:hypothetical protein
VLPAADLRRFNRGFARVDGVHAEIIGKFHAFVNRAFWRILMAFGLFAPDCHIGAMFCNWNAGDAGYILLQIIGIENQHCRPHLRTLEMVDFPHGKSEFFTWAPGFINGVYRCVTVCNDAF